MFRRLRLRSDSESQRAIHMGSTVCREKRGEGRTDKSTLALPEWLHSIPHLFRQRREERAPYPFRICIPPFEPRSPYSILLDVASDDDRVHRADLVHLVAERVHVRERFHLVRHCDCASAKSRRPYPLENARIVEGGRLVQFEAVVRQVERLENGVVRERRQAVT